MKWMLAVIIVSAALGCIEDTDAMTFEMNGEISDFLRIIHRGEDYMLIGARNRITNLSLVTMTSTNVYSWLPRTIDEGRCPMKDRTEGPLALVCESVYPRSMQKISDDRYLLCGSNPYKQNCREFNYTSDEEGEGQWQIREIDWVDYHSNDPNIPSVNWSFDRYGFASTASPTHPYTDLLMVATEDLVYYTVTMSDPYNNHAIPIMYKLPKYPHYNNQNDTAISITQNNKGIFNFDLSKQREVQPAPIFAHLLLTTYSVYTIFSEVAMEVYGQSQRHARIARVCRNDPGTKGSNSKFVTFTKARLLCGSFQEIVVSDANKNMNRIQKPNLGYSFDIVAHATNPHLSIIGGTHEKVLVAVFNSDSALFNGSAVCAYRMADIETSFYTGHILNITDRPASIRESSTPPPKCNVSITSNMGDKSEDLSFNAFLLKKEINPIDKFPLFYQFATPYRYSKIVVHYDVEAADGTKHDIIFIGTDDGTLIQLANNTGTYEKIEERQIFKGEPIKEMELVHIVQHDRPYLMLNSLRQLKRVGLEKCHNHETCSDCVSVRNPYCSWSPLNKRCVATHHNATDRIQNLITGTDDRCILEDKKDASTTEQMIESTTPPILVKPERVTEEEEGDAGMIAGIAIACAVVFGLLGFAAGMSFSRRIQRNPTKNLDHLSESKCNDVKLDADGIGDNCERKQMNTSHNTYNTLNNGKIIVNDTNATDSTLARQKKSYV